MKTMEKINELKGLLENAITANADGRQIVVNSCKELYNIIEEDAVKVGSEWMLDGFYKDLCLGNFAEPFMCEQKKHEFLVSAKIYEERILPRL